jgi:hypothetical protein
MKTTACQKAEDERRNLECRYAVHTWEDQMKGFRIVSRPSMVWPS